VSGGLRTRKQPRRKAADAFFEGCPYLGYPLFGIGSAGAGPDGHPLRIEFRRGCLPRVASLGGGGEPSW